MGHLDGTFTITVASTPAQVIINEIRANEPGRNTAGEFVEIVNIMLHTSISSAQSSAGVRASGAPW